MSRGKDPSGSARLPPTENIEIKYSIFKTSFKCSQLISRIYRILLGEEDIPTSERNIFFNNKSYTDKVYNKSISDMIRDKHR